ncbi:MAG: hypothetical protein FD130_1988, partial [Halothiobacillaceae bacterium]
VVVAVAVAVAVVAATAAREGAVEQVVLPMAVQVTR